MLLVLVLFLACPAGILAQASPYISTDHPSLPLVEYLIARGDIEDPSPMVRPLRRSDVVEALRKAPRDSTSSVGRIISSLEREFADPDTTLWFKTRLRVGLEGFTRARRDLTHPAGDDGIESYVDASLEWRFDRIVLVSRPSAENRLKLDPDWVGGSLQRRKNLAYRFVEGYLSAQFQHARIFVGQMSRNWGPPGQTGLSIGDAAYPRPDFSLELLVSDLQLQFLAAPLGDIEGRDSALRHRVFLAHRMSVRLSKRWQLALWETAILAARSDRSLTRGLNPFVLLSFPIQMGIEDERNTIIGGDFSWRAGRRMVVRGQAMIDDRWRLGYHPKTGEKPHPGRYALQGSLAGALGDRLGFTLGAGLVSNLAYRTIDSSENFVDNGQGIGPQFPDNVAASAAVHLPISGRWLLSPKVAVLAQGEGRLDAVFPLGDELSATPEVLDGTVSTTTVVGADFQGRAGHLDFAGEAGWYHTSNAGHVTGRTTSRLEGRFRATIALTTQRVLR